jgi:RNA recognition motif-containing protein
MRYLKKFNESASQEVSIEELVKFCDEYLAYLKDSGFDISITKPADVLKKYTSHLNYIIIRLFKKGNTNYKFDWSEIKYDFIPFFEILSIKYKLDKFYDDFCIEVVVDSSEIFLTKDDVMRDRKDPKGINYLWIKVQDKKDTL